jgi:hypothetical protein
MTGGNITYKCMVPSSLWAKLVFGCIHELAYFLCLIESVIFYLFSTSCLTAHLIQNFCINAIDFIITYFIIRDTLIIIYLFYYLHKNFE